MICLYQIRLNYVLTQNANIWSARSEMNKILSLRSTLVLGEERKDNISPYIVPK